MMALIPATKRERARSRLNNRYLPSELLEEILLNLPQKSLVRFSAVSKSWNSMIFDPVFTRKHKNRAALLRRHRLAVYTNADPYGVALMCSDLGSMVAMKRHRSGFDTNIDARDFVGEFEGKPHLLACCDELWCVQVETSIFLWNPSMRNVVRVPLPSSYIRLDDFLYGLGYDSVNDDYKILRIARRPDSTTELYSLKNNCWRTMEPFSSPDFAPSSIEQICDFVGGRFHWIGRTATGAPIIVSFDLSTEKYGDVARPDQYDNDEEDYDHGDEEDFNELEVDDDDEEDFNELEVDDDYEEDFNELDDEEEEDFNDDFNELEVDDDEEDFDQLGVITLNGKLCAYSTCTSVDGDTEESRFVLWAMEEYGVEKSWTKRFDVMLPHLVVLGDRSSIPENLIPLYFSDNDILVIQGDCGERTYILMYRNGEAARPRWEIVKCETEHIHKANAFFYVESLITVRIRANTHIRFVE